MTEAASPLGPGGGRPDDGIMPGRTDAEPTTVGILVVDDQAPFRSAARTLVRLVGGWRVVGEAVTGEEAVTMAAETHPDAVLMDITRPETAVVLLSTYPADDLPQDPTSCGAVGYLRKEAVTPAALRALLAPSR